MHSSNVEISTMSQSNPFDPHRSVLFTDLYELTMLQAYHAEGMAAPAVFELFFREMPEKRNFIMAAGLEDVLDYLERLRFTEDELSWLQTRREFSPGFLEALRDFRFTGEVYAVPEGTLVFANEPLIQVVAPLPQAQLIETYVLNQIHLQSVTATKAARVLMAAQGRTVVDFGSRRSHGTDAALKVGRTSYLAGFAGTSNVAAGRLYEVPIFGTMAHSYIQAHPDELSAFSAFAQEYPETTLLVDTYDTLQGVENVVALARRLGASFKVRAIRLDSGDLAELAKQARQLLDHAGLEQVKIFASSGLNEYKIRDLLAAGTPIDGFGVGSDLAVSSDAPQIDFSYKLVAYDGQPQMKLSSRKVSMPGRKQVFRAWEGGRMLRDLIALHAETHPGEPLLEPVMSSGRRLSAGRVTLGNARAHAQAQLEALPPELKAFERVAVDYPVQVSPDLQRMTAALRRKLEQQTRG
jgi:nicotinate phosphoribosyltransferase